MPGVEPRPVGLKASVLPMRHSAVICIRGPGKIALLILHSPFDSFDIQIFTIVWRHIFSWWHGDFWRKINVELVKVVMSIPGPLIRDGGNTNPSYQLQPLVSTDLTRGFLSWLGATREISWYSGLELILGVRILPPSLMGSRYRYNPWWSGRNQIYCHFYRSSDQFKCLYFGK